VFWVGTPDTPYEAGILFRAGSGGRRSPEYYLFRLAPDAGVWFPVQVGERSADLGGVGNAGWVDLNLDGIPELLSWTEAPPNELFKLCLGPDCPKYLVQRIFQWQRGKGYQLDEERVISTPFATLQQFVLALQAGEDRLAGAFVTGPGLVQEARALQWDRLEGEGAIEVYRDRSAKAWPDRIRITVPAPDSEKRVPIEVQFERRQNRWLISEFVIRIPSSSEDTSAPEKSAGDNG
jgi:hypothetical protein